jgi:type II secretory pathway pseudopilin PulG
MSNVEGKIKIRISPITFRSSSFVIRLPRRSRAKAGHSSFRSEASFTIIELLIVIAIIVILAGLILSTAGYVQKKGARSRAEAEIAAISAALESYKADNGIYPRDTTTNTTDNLNARTSGNPCGYQAASLYLYKQLSGDTNANFQYGAKSYFTFKPNMLGTSTTTTTDACGNTLTPTTVSYIRDPFGTIYVNGIRVSLGIYGYSTAQAANPGSNTLGYNPTFDLWSTGGNIDTNNPPNQTQWIKNW